MLFYVSLSDPSDALGMTLKYNASILMSFLIMEFFVDVS